MSEMKEPQYESFIELKASQGLATLGLMSNQVWHDDPKRLGIMLARYKFVSKMLAGMARVLEVGCGDAFGSRVVQREVGELLVTDFDPIFIDTVQGISKQVHDMVKAPLPGPWNGIYAIDVLEHIQPCEEHKFIQHAKDSLDPHGVLILGIPSAESQAYASPISRNGHVNCKSGSYFKKLMLLYFHNVFLFSMNDEVVHTGFSPMAHYLWVICTGKR